MSHLVEIPSGDHWSDVHDLAIVFVACMHGGDKQLDPVEMDQVRTLLCDWFPSLAKEDVDRVLSEVVLIFYGRTGSDLLSSAVFSLSEQLSREEQIDVLKDLTRVASADGMVFRDEISFITELAKAWRIERLPSDN